MLQLYDYQSSGNGYKVRLMLNLLGLPFERVEVDILAGEALTPAFMSKNPNAEIPALELDDGTVLAESNAILFYLAEGSALLPDTRLERAQTLQWMFFEQYSHEPNVAVARFMCLHPAQGQSEDEALATDRTLAEKQQQGHAALSVMEGHLADRPYFVAGRYSIADIALYAYTHVAEEGGIELARYSAIRTWLGRVAAQPGHIPL